MTVCSDDMEGTFGQITNFKKFTTSIIPYTVLLVRVNKTPYNSAPKNIAQWTLTAKEFATRFPDVAIKVPKEPCTDHRELYGALLVSQLTSTNEWHTTQFLDPLHWRDLKKKSISERTIVYRNMNKKIGFTIKQSEPHDDEEEWLPFALKINDMVYPLYVKMLPIDKKIVTPESISMSHLSGFIAKLHAIGHTYNDVKSSNFVWHARRGVVFCDYGSIAPMASIKSIKLYNINSTFPCPWIFKADTKNVREFIDDSDDDMDDDSDDAMSDAALSDGKTCNKSVLQLFTSYMAHHIHRTYDFKVLYKQWMALYKTVKKEHILMANDWFGLGLFCLYLEQFYGFRGAVVDQAKMYLCPSFQSSCIAQVE